VADWFDDGGSGRACDVPALLDSAAHELVAECVGLGALVSLGLSSDGGALACTVTCDGRWRREWFRDSDELVSWLGTAVEAVKLAYGREQTASSGQRSRPRRRAQKPA
jgi:hypothetical protein